MTSAPLARLPIRRRAALLLDLPEQRIPVAPTTASTTPAVAALASSVSHHSCAHDHSSVYHHSCAHGRGRSP